MRASLLFVSKNVYFSEARTQIFPLKVTKEVKEKREVRRALPVLVVSSQQTTKLN